MTEYLITSPEGKQFRITAPEGATKEQALDYFKQNYKPQPSFEDRFPKPDEQMPTVERDRPLRGITPAFGEARARELMEGFGGQAGQTLAAPYVAGKGVVESAKNLYRDVTGGQRQPSQEARRYAAAEKTGESAADWLADKLGLAKQNIPFVSSGTKAVGGGLLAPSPTGVARGAIGSFAAGVGAEAGGKLAGTPGAIAGAALGGLAGGAKKPPEAKIPTQTQLFDAADAAYENVKNMKVKIPVADTMTLADQIKDKLNTEYAIYKDTPGAERVFRQVERLSDASSASHVMSNEIFSIEKALNGVARRNPGTEPAAAAGIARREILDFMAKYPQFKSELETANAIYRAAKTSEAITNAAQKGEFSAGASGRGDNIDNALRQNIKSLYLNKKVNKTPEEKAIMEAIITGDNSQLSKVNIARRMSKASAPVRALGHALTHILGSKTGVPFVREAVQLFAAHVAERHTQANVRKLDKLVRTSSPLGPGTSPPAKLGGQRALQAARGASQAPNIFQP
jgi:hypothetical protein